MSCTSESELRCGRAKRATNARPMRRIRQAIGALFTRQRRGAGFVLRGVAGGASEGP
jgi:hypothetical protein